MRRQHVPIVLCRLSLPHDIKLSLHRLQSGIAPYLLVLDTLNLSPVRDTQRKIRWLPYESNPGFAMGLIRWL